ncbi:MAG: efflux RND transporter periplasmic adaptor subunit [Terriglobales bacterium]
MATQANANYSIATAGMGRITRDLRLSGTTEAVSNQTIRVPRIRGASFSKVLVSIVQSGNKVNKGEVLATFDDTTEVEHALDDKAVYEAEVHQVANQVAVNKANAEQRAATLKQAQTNLGTAELNLEEAPILSEIQAKTDAVEVANAKADITSILKQNALQTKADIAALRVMELQRDQDKVNWERDQANVDALTMRAPISGMVGLVPVFNSDGSMGPAEPGDQLHTGQSIVRIFDPTNMEVNAEINEADDATLTPGLKGIMHLDAYPAIALPVHLVSVSPVAVATGGFGDPIRTFAAIFHVDGANPKLLPDLSASIDIQVTSSQGQLLVPRGAVHFTQSQPYVTVLDPGGAWKQRRVELGIFDNDQVQILSGLKTGEQVQVPSAVIGEGE